MPQWSERARARRRWSRRLDTAAWYLGALMDGVRHLLARERNLPSAEFWASREAMDDRLRNAGGI